MFSTSATTRLPDRISNSLTSPDPELVTLKFVGPAFTVSFAGHPSSSISTLTLVPFAPAVPAVARNTLPLNNVTSSARPVVRNVGTDLLRDERWTCGSDGFDGLGDRSGDGVGARAGSLRPADVDGHRDRVHEEGEDLAPRRFGLDPEHAGDQCRLHGTRIDQPTQVDRALEQEVPPAGLVRGVHREREQPRADEHQHDPGDAEELRQVELHATAVDEVAEDDGDGDAEQGAGAGESRAIRLLERGEHEHC